MSILCHNSGQRQLLLRIARSEVGSGDAHARGRCGIAVWIGASARRSSLGFLG